MPCLCTHPGDPGCRDTPSTVTTTGLAPARPEEGYCFCLVSIALAWHLPMGSLRSSTGALVIHPGLISVTKRVSPVTSHLPESGFPHWNILLSLAMCALGTWPHPGAGQGACGRAGGYFTGYFTCWHQLFLPSAHNHIPPPSTTHPASATPPQGTAMVVAHCVPLFLPLVTHSLVSGPMEVPPGFLLLGQ